MHDKYKYYCDVCYTEFTRLYALNNHKKAGRCKLDLHKNPIINVTPLGMLPTTSHTEKVNDWLNPSPAPKRQRSETMCERPSTSTNMDKGPSTSATNVCVKGARKQLATQAATALPPRDHQWNPRNPFSLHLPTGHQDQKTLGDLPASATPRKRNSSPLSLPLPAFALRSPTPTYPSDTEERVLGQTSHYSGSTRPAGTPTSSHSSGTLSQMAAEVLRGLDASGESHQTPASSPALRSSSNLEEDLALSDEDNSSGLPDPGLNCPVVPVPLSDEESTYSIPDSNQEVAHLLPGNRYWTTDLEPSCTINEAAARVKKDIDLLLALNSKVAPRDQVPLLCEIHGQLQRFLTPYLLYHRV